MRHIKYFLLILSLLLFNVQCEKKSDPLAITKMLDYNFIPIVEGTLNGHKCYFLLDTGASISILDINQTKNYNVRKFVGDDVGVVGYGGVTMVNYDLENYSIYLGNVKLTEDFQGKDIGTIVKTISKQTNYKIVGIIGNNNIATNDFILNFKTGEIIKN